MPDMHPLERAFLADIIDNHADDTPRLIYADWLEDNDSVIEIPCPRCDEYRCAYGNFGGPGYHPERSVASGRHEGGWTNCKTCNSGAPGQIRAGIVRRHNYNAVRAEFIRVQIALSKPGLSCDRFMYSCGEIYNSRTGLATYGCDNCRKWAKLVLREAELFETQGADGKFVIREECGIGQESAYGIYDMANLTENYDLSRSQNTQMILWKRGFIQFVRCSMQSWIDHGPTVASRHPIEKVHAIDKRPDRVVSGKWRWYSAFTMEQDPYNQDIHATDSQDILPEPIFDVVHKYRWGNLPWDTEQQALEALAVGLPEWARIKAKEMQCS